MTIQETLRKHLVDRGLRPLDALAIVNLYGLSNACPADMANRFGDHTEGYPPQLMAALVFGVRQVALDWIDSNKPKHFARLLLVEPA